MKFDLENLNPATSFPLDHDDPEAGSIDLRVASSEALEGLRKKHVKTRVQYHKGQRHEVQDVDHENYDKGLWDYCIVGWKGLLDAKGKAIPCNAENKVKLMKGSPVFSQLVRDRLEQLSEEQQERLKDAEKN